MQEFAMRLLDITWTIFIIVMCLAFLGLVAFGALVAIGWVISWLLEFVDWIRRRVRGWTS